MTSEEKSEKLLGDAVKEALSLVGVTEERITAWLGVPCGCSERREKLNQLHRWAKRVLRGKTENAEGFLKNIVE